MPKTSAIILAAGKGTRMGTPYPKALAELHGKPLVFWVIENIINSGADEVIVVIGHQGDLVKSAVEKGNFQVKFVNQQEQLGTGHATKIALPEVDADVDTVIVTYSDMPFISSNLYKGMVEKQQRAGAAVVLSSVFFDEPLGPAFGRVVRSDQGNIEQIVEQKLCTPDQLKITECNAGPVAYDANWLRGAITKINISASGEYYLTDLVEIASREGKLVESVKIVEQGHAHGVNTLTHLEQAHEIKNL